MAKPQAHVEKDYQAAKEQLAARAKVIKDAKAVNLDASYRRIKALVHKHLRRLNAITRYDNINAEVAKAKAARAQQA